MRFIQSWGTPIKSTCNIIILYNDKAQSLTPRSHITIEMRTLEEQCQWGVPPCGAVMVGNAGVMEKRQVPQWELGMAIQAYRNAG